MAYPLIGFGAAKVAPSTKIFVKQPIVSRSTIVAKQWNPGIFRLPRTTAGTRMYRGPVTSIVGPGLPVVPTTGQIWPRANR